MNWRNHEGFTIWFTGLTGAGKTTVSRIVAKKLLKMGYKVEILDGDEVRKNLSDGLGFTKEDRDRNIRRIGYVCKLLSRNGVIAIAAAISPYRDTREENRRQIGNYVEVYVKCPIEVCQERDIKGIYRRARKGEIDHVAGISDPYEEPEDPEVVVETHLRGPEECAQEVIDTLMEMGYIEPRMEEAEEAYSDEEKKVIEKRLADLGYI